MSDDGASAVDTKAEDACVENLGIVNSSAGGLGAVGWDVGGN